MKTMARNSLFIFFVLSRAFSLEGSSPSFLIDTNKGSISVKTSSSQKDLKIKPLEDRVALLEHAVRELQDKVYHLSSKPSFTTSKPIEIIEEKTIWSCYLRDSFGKTFTGKAETKTQASAFALKDCGGGLHCKKEKLKCSSEKQTNKKIISHSGSSVIEVKKKKTWNCFLQDDFNQTYTGKGETETEAKANALKSCGFGVSCKENRLTCSHN